MSAGGASGDSQGGGSQNHAWEPWGCSVSAQSKRKGFQAIRQDGHRSLMGVAGDCGRVSWHAGRTAFSSVTHGRG